MRCHTLNMTAIILLVLISSSFITMSTSGSASHVFKRQITLYAPAVTRSGEGALIQVNLTLVYPGHGMVYFSARPLVETDTQATARIAAYVASTITGSDYYSYDYYVVMTSGSMIVGGPSAGALMTIGFISLFLNKTLNPHVSMTGMINPDGSIGPVGGLLGKLQAVASHGYKVFLIPLGERTVYVEKRVVKKTLWGYYESIQYVPVDLVAEGEKYNVSVIEVANIFDVMKYFLNITVNKPVIIPANIPGELYNAVKKYALENTEKSEELFNESVKMFGRLDLFTRINLYGKIQANAEIIKELEQLINENKTLAAYYYSEKAVAQSLYLNWLLKASTNQLDVENILSILNTTINETHRRLADALMGERVDPLLIMAEKHLYDAVARYSEVISKNGSIGQDEIRNLAFASTDLLFSDQFLNLSRTFTKYKVAVDQVILTLYSISDSALSYAISLAQDVGRSNEFIESASDYFIDAINAYIKNYTYASIGLFIDTIVYADLGIEELFITNETVYSNITDYLIEELGYYYNGSNIKDYLIYSYRATSEFSSINDYESAIQILLRSIMFSLIFSNNTKFSLVPVHPTGQNTSITNSSTTTTTSETSPQSPENEGLRFREPDNVVYYVLGLVTGLALGIVIYYVYSIVGRTRRTGEHV